MRVRANVLANFLGQGYTVLAGVGTAPLYLEHLGSEAFGLVGFYMALNAWLVIFGFGLGPALEREVAKNKAHAPGRLELAKVFLSFEILMGALALALCLALNLASDWLGRSWLNPQALDARALREGLQLLALALALRWHSALYRNAINGFEAQVWLNQVDAVLITLRFFAPLGAFLILDPSLGLYFLCQVGAALLELVLLRLKVRRLLPLASTPFQLHVSSVKPLLPFALSALYASILGLGLSQLDRLVLSAALSLEEFGYFSLAVLICGGLQNLSAPVAKALLPRLTALLQAQDRGALQRTYLHGSRWIVCALAPIVFVIALWPGETIYVWTGNTAATSWLGAVLPFFVLGVGLGAISSSQYFLQFAAGRLTYNIRLNTGLVLVNTPVLAYLAQVHGAVAVGAFLLCVRGGVFLFFVPFVHRKLFPGIHGTWLLHAVLAPLFVVGAALFVADSLGNALAGLVEGLPERVALGLRLFGMLLAAYGSAAFWALRTANWARSPLLLHKPAGSLTKTPGIKRAQGSDDHPF